MIQGGKEGDKAFREIGATLAGDIKKGLTDEFGKDTADMIMNLNLYPLILEDFLI